MRLRCAYYITCKEVRKNAAGDIEAIVCSYDPESRGGGTPDNRKVKGTLHWVSAAHARPGEVRLYDHLFAKDDPEDVPEGETFLHSLNPDSLKTVTAALDPSLTDLPPGGTVQFERLGYFCPDPDSSPDRPIFNRTVTLKDTWAKVEKQDGRAPV